MPGIVQESSSAALADAMLSKKIRKAACWLSPILTIFDVVCVRVCACIIFNMISMISMMPNWRHAKMRKEQLMERALRYSADPLCNWRSHGDYFGIEIERCFFGDQAKALYRARHLDGFLYSRSLDGIKDGIKAAISGGNL